MRTIVVFSFLTVMMNVSIMGQISAITSTGEEVILYESGSWRYVSEQLSDEKEIIANPDKFVRASNATFLVKSKITNVGIYINPKEWSFQASPEGEASEFQFELKEGDLYGLVITEKLEIPLMTLRGIVVENARNVSPDITVVHEEYRNVNGVDILQMQMEGTIQGMQFTYYGYYYSSPKGTMQLLTYTGTSLMNEYQSKIEDFLNGFVLINE